MADVSTAIRTRLLAHAGTAALISTRCWFGFLEEPVQMPALTVQEISAVRFPLMGSDAEKVQFRVQVDAWAATRAGVKALADQVRAALQRWGGSSGGTTVIEAFMDNEAERFEDGVRTWRIQMDFLVWVDE
jgi:hypothetical protein